jgi:thiamine-phosphate pyrophosphorylase
MADFREALHGLYAITPDDHLTPRLVALVEAALQGGARLVQYRNKQAPIALRRVQATELLRLCHRHGARLIVNDDVWLAVEIGADGAHVGEDDLDLRTAREALGARRILGVSCYADQGRVATAVRDGADYVGIGSMFASTTKPGATAASLELLGEARRRFDLPVAAIGGITLRNAPKVVAAGADMVAVVSDLFNAMDIGRRATEFGNLFDQGRKSRLP